MGALQRMNPQTGSSLLVHTQSMILSAILTSICESKITAIARPGITAQSLASNNTYTEYTIARKSVVHDVGLVFPKMLGFPGIFKLKVVKHDHVRKTR